MAELSFAAGEFVFLNIHLGSGVAGKYPQATIKNAAGTVLATVDMTDTGGGSYFNGDTYPMPNLPFIQVVYKVYDDAGHTILSEDDQEGSVIMALKDVFEALIRNDAIEGVFEQVGGSIEGVLSSSGQITAQMELSGGDLAGVVVSNELTGVMEDTSPSFVGVVKCA